LSFADERDGERRRKSDEDTDDTPKSSMRKKKQAPVPEVGNALRSAYQRTLDEDIPPEMLDLLGKLG
jgi:hypothetical protein